MSQKLSSNQLQEKIEQLPKDTREYPDEIIHQNDMDEFRQVHCFFHTVTERGEKQNLSKRAKDVWALTFDAIDDIVTVQDESMRIIRANRKARQFFQLQDGDLSGRYCYEVFSGKSDPCPICPIRTAFLNGESSSAIISYEKLGKIFQITSSIIPSYVGSEKYLVHVARDITQQQETKKALQESEERFSKAFGSNPAPMVISDIKSGLFIDVNQRWLEMLGYSKEELIGQTSRAVGIWKNPEERNRMVTEFCSKGFIREFPVTYKTKSGETRSVLRSAEKIALGGREVMLSLVYDFTKRQKTERTLRESEQKFALAFEASPDAVNINRLEDGMYVEINRGFTELTGFTLDDVHGKTSRDIDIWDNPADRQRLIRALKDTGYCENLEAQFRRKDGSLATGLMSARTISLNSIPHIISITRDISQRKKTETERDRLVAAIEQTNEVIVIADPQGNIQYVNPAFETVTGYSQKEVIGQNPRILKSGEQDEQFYKVLWKTISSGKTFKGLMVNKRKNGTLYTEEATISPVCAADGRVINYVAVKRDITDRILLESQLHQAQKMESVGRLTGGVAHDFNNILGVIIGYAELALMKGDSCHNLHDDLEKILDAAKRSADIVRQLLAFSRQQPINPVALDLNSTVEEMLKILRRLIGEDIELAWIPQPDLSSIKMDPTQMSQILANLCINARDAINGAGRITIESAMVTIEEEYCTDHVGFLQGEFVQLAVSDNGCGIGNENQEKIFEPFFTTKELGHGTGLGLSTVYGIVKQNHGFINVYSEKGKGTTFKLYFPPCTDKKLKSERAIGKGIEKGNGETILLVEDDPILLAMACRMLKRLDYQVLAADTPSEAYSLAGEYPGNIHLLLTDVIMPEMNGKELANLMHSRHRDLKCLFTSGYTASVIEQSGVLDKHIHFIQKPYSINSLALKISEVLHG